MNAQTGAAAASRMRGRTMDLQQAYQVLGVEANSSWETVLQARTTCAARSRGVRASRAGADAGTPCTCARGSATSS